jgi:hypothetical protein
MTFVEQFNQKADQLMDRLRTMADGETSIRLFDEFNGATLDAVQILIHNTLVLFFYLLKVILFPQIAQVKNRDVRTKIKIL